MRLQRGGERCPQASRCAIHNPHALALNDSHGREDPQLPQPLVRAGRQIEARRIGAIDDIEVVVAGNDQHSFDETGMTQDSAQEFGPLARATGVGHVPAQHDGVERIARVHKVQLREQPRQALVAAGP